MADSLLDFLQTPDAQLGLSLLAAAGPTARPVGIGERVFGALQTVQGQQDAAMKRQLLQSQLDENRSQAAYRAAQLGQLQQDQALTGVIMDRFKARSAPGAGGAALPANAAPGAVPVGSPSGGAPASIGGGVAASSGGAPAGVGGYPFSLDEIAMLTAMGRKGADGLFNQYKYASDGIKRDSGSFYQDPISGAVKYFPKLGEGQVMGANGAVGMAPGYIEANAVTKGTETRATEAAKYPFTVGADRARQTTQAALDPMKVVGEDGNEYYLPRLQVAGAGAGGGAGGGGGAQGSGGFMAGRNPVIQQSQTALNDNWIKSTYQPTLDAGKAASDATASLTALRGIDLNTGWGTEAKATAANALVGLGIAPKNAEIFASNAQKFQAVAMKQLLQTFEGQKGQQTEGDARRVSQTFAALSNTPDANAFLIDFAQAKANLDARKAAYYEQALPIAQKRGDLTEVDRQWRKVAGSVWADPVMQRWAK